MKTSCRFLIQFGTPFAFRSGQSGKRVPPTARPDPEETQTMTKLILPAVALFALTFAFATADSAEARGFHRGGGGIHIGGGGIHVDVGNPRGFQGGGHGFNGYAQPHWGGGWGGGHGWNGAGHQGYWGNGHVAIQPGHWNGGYSDYLHH